ncbi:hypothetical protein J4Q44_G00049990 [Coregonus suidteri]|uniref:Uncharacterized protein n=1 Tax=Coregonus suidteri TaxID=861788 RepID=A0AAN8RFJ3_9TELE
MKVFPSVVPSFDNCHGNTSAFSYLIWSLVSYCLTEGGFLGLMGGLSQSVRTQQVVTATLGEDAVLNCELMKPKDKRQKATAGANVNVATHSKRWGPVVNPPYKDKVEFEDEELQTCAIFIRGVSRGDECCFKCLFNAYRDGAISGRTCLSKSMDNLMTF